MQRLWPHLREDQRGWITHAEITLDAEILIFLFGVGVLVWNANNRLCDVGFSLHERSTAPWGHDIVYYMADTGWGGISIVNAASFKSNVLREIDDAFEDNIARVINLNRFNNGIAIIC